MNNAERERLRSSFCRSFYNCNQRWQFNGRAFESQMSLYRSHIAIDAFFESKANQVTVWLMSRRVFKRYVDISGPKKTFKGEDCMIEALNWLSDSFYTIFDEIQRKEWEAVNGASIETLNIEVQTIFNKIAA